MPKKGEEECNWAQLHNIMGHLDARCMIFFVFRRERKKEKIRGIALPQVRRLSTYTIELGWFPTDGPLDCGMQVRLDSHPFWDI